MTSDFYRAFEDRYRGSRDLIKSRLQIYVPFIQPLLAQYPGGHAIDIGCGRGEWLELATELGLSTTGVDLDDGMLAACRERGLNVITGDGLALLKSLPDDSQVVVSGFHFAEHIPFDSLEALVKEALRVLQPGGLLILETPNPENIAVGACHFYLDPSHHRPIPPQLLSFLPEYHGFARTKVLRLQEPPHLVGDALVTLNDVLVSVSPDYAVVAQKDGDTAIIAATSEAFGRDYGLSLNSLAHRYDRQWQVGVQAAHARAQENQERIEQAEARLAQAEIRAGEAYTRAAQAEGKANQIEIRAAQAEIRATQADTHAKQAELKASRAADRIAQVQVGATVHAAEMRAAQAEAMAREAAARAAQAEACAQQASSMAQGIAAQMGEVLNSTSWRVTKPLRWVRTLINRRRLPKG